MESYSEIDCIHCEYNQKCCNELGVTLTKEEVLSEFFDAKVVPLTESRKILGYVMVLNKANGACVYLDEKGLCSIYENRPQVCKKFTCVGKSWHK